MQRILHVDMDAFYASVEALYRPDLKGVPFVVGHDDGHGIVTTASYEAREFGIHSAMPMFMAKSLCPELIVVPIQRQRYVAYSKKLMKLYYSFTDIVEQVSIDEAYLDIGNGDLQDLLIAKRLQAAIYNNTGLTASIGQSYNKFLAKLASDWNKPRGLTLIVPNQIPALLKPLPVGKVHGIGPKTEAKLKEMGITTIAQMLTLEKGILESHFGKWGLELYDRIRGIDHRQVSPTRERKSISVEKTFQDTASREKLEEYLREFAEELHEDLIRNQVQGKTITIKIKDYRFKLWTKSHTLLEPIHESEDLFQVGKWIFDDMEVINQVRLLGLTVSHLMPLNSKQLDFWDNLEELT